MWKKLWKILLVILIVIIAIYFPVILSYVGELLLTAGFGGMSAATIALAASVPWWAGAVVGLGLAYLIDPASTSEIIADVGGVVGDIGTAVGGAVGDTLGSVLGKAWPYLLAAGAAWLLLKDKKDDKAKADPKVKGATNDGPQPQL